MHSRGGDCVLNFAPIYRLQHAFAPPTSHTTSLLPRPTVMLKAPRAERFGYQIVADFGWMCRLSSQ